MTTVTELTERFDDGVAALEQTVSVLDEIAGSLAAIRENLDDICNRGRVHVETHQGV